MTLNMLGAPRIPYVVAPQAQFADRRPADTPERGTLSEQRAVDDTTLSLTQPRELQIVDESRSLAALKFKSHLKVKQTDDGALKVKFKSQLKFNYEFQSEDGTTIRLSAKVKTRISYEQTGEDSFELKARVKVQLSMVQEAVESSLAPVLDSDGVTDEQSSVISSAFQDFSDLVDRMTTQFLDDTLVGDDLIVNIVSAFNELTRSAQSELPREAEPPIVPAEEPLLAVSAEVADDSASPVAVADQDVSPVDITMVENELQSYIGNTPNVDQSSEQPVGNIGVTGDGEMTEGETDDPLEIVANSGEAEMPAVTSSYSARSLFVGLRVKFSQSLSHLVSVLDSPSGDTNRSLMNASFR
ncbi:MAG: hypothetical protein HQ567_25960, partial [Candidatus Nealsonbacteria bacterium]|nr:hypothetical protein [Candidatus Nealsonbacteria bacterium]